VVLAGDLIGVLTIYSADANFFSEEHERLLEAVAKQTAAAFRRCIRQGLDVDGVALVDMGNAASATSTQLPDRTCITLIDVDEQSKDLTPDDLEAIAIELNDAAEFGKAVFRRGPRQFAILSAGADESAVSRIVSRRLGRASEVRFAVAAAPKHGNTLQQLLDFADDRLRKRKGSSAVFKDSIH
jgi:hypothetical protein